jgi:hypothetical protein
VLISYGIRGTRENNSHHSACYNCYSSVVAQLKPHAFFGLLFVLEVLIFHPAHMGLP